MRTCMKYLSVLIVLVAFFVAPAIAQTPPAPPSAWFDMENCEMCKPLMAQPGLMHNMTWEQHPIANGIVSITTVREPFMKQYKEAQVKMAEIAKRLQAGETVALCPSCVAFGQCVMKGAKLETVEIKHGDLMIATSDNPELVVEMQAWARRSTEEMKKMEEMQKEMKKEGEAKK